MPTFDFPAREKIGQKIGQARKIFPLGIMALALSGCALFRERPTKYVTVYCITPEQFEQIRKAEPPKVHNLLTGEADKDTRTLGGSAIRLRAWGDGVLEILGGCVEPKPNAAPPDAHELADKILDEAN
jgi:hypothetical protein